MNPGTRLEFFTGYATELSPAEGRFTPRPHMVTIGLFLLMYGYLFVLRPQLSNRQLLGVFAAMVVWVNAHSGFVLFPAVVIGYVVVEALQRRQDSCFD